MAKKLNECNFERELQQWTDTWEIISSDPPIGKELLNVIQTFVSTMTGQGLPLTTVNRHLLNLWLLCGEIIRYVRDDRKLKRLSSYELFLRFVDAEGGPSCSQLASEQEQQSFDATCRQLFQHLTMPMDKA